MERGKCAVSKQRRGFNYKHTLVEQDGYYAGGWSRLEAGIVTANRNSRGRSAKDRAARDRRGQCRSILRIGRLSKT